MSLTPKQKKGIAYIAVGAILIGGGIWAVIYFSKDEEARSGDSSDGDSGQGKGCPAGETYNTVSKKCCHPTIARVGCVRAGQGKGTPIVGTVKGGALAGEGKG